jgi:hypothetical protein
MEGLPILAGSILRLPLWSYSKDQKKKQFLDSLRQNLYMHAAKCKIMDLNINFFNTIE